MRELLSNNSLFVGQLCADKSLALCARNLVCFTTDPQTMNYYSKFTARADIFLKNKFMNIAHSPIDLLFYRSQSHFRQVTETAFGGDE